MIPRTLTCLLALLLAACAQSSDAGDAAAAADSGPRAANDSALRAIADAGGGLGTPDAAPPPPEDAAVEPTDGASGDAVADAAPASACSDGLDNDGDGRVDDADPGCDGPGDDDEGDEIALPECADAEDNDGDELIDLFDPGCTSTGDPRESGDEAPSACANGLDDDGDGAVDFPDDLGCAAVGDDDETSPDRPPACANGEDDDGDGETDFPLDPGCAGRGDSSEDDPPRLPDCANGADDDGDGAADFPDDPGCESAGDFRETGACGPDVALIDLNRAQADAGHADGTTAGAPENTVGSCGGGAGGERVFAYRIDRPLERLIFSTEHPETVSPTVVYVRRHCRTEGDLSCNRGSGENPGTHVELEQPAQGHIYVFVDTGSRDGGGVFRLTAEAIATPACRDALDNDEDGRVDAEDPGCVERDDPDEADPPEPAQCSDGIDNDDDGHTDYPDDPDCAFAGGPREEPLCPPGAPILPVGQAGGQFELPAVMGQGGASPSCDAAIGPEVILQITLEDPSDVTVDVLEGADPAAVALHARSACRDAETELACRRSADSGRPLVLRNVPRGPVYVLVEQGFVAPPVPRVAIVTVVSVITECNDERDNDNDGRVDLADPGCSGGRDDSELDGAAAPECDDGIDNDEDGQTDWPDDRGCVAAGDPNEGGCQGDPAWRPVECVTAAWLWSSDRAIQDLQAANDAHVLWSGCRHAGDNPEGLCSLDGTGWISADSFVMAGCNDHWWHIGGQFTGACGGHDGDTVRYMALGEDDCWDYRAE